jgi:hypothetical protein
MFRGSAIGGGRLSFGAQIMGIAALIRIAAVDPFSEF